ncbi:unnamed protein product [Rhizophagus irregularis]|uniref:Uncharacterized protein n=1 Tax=Rhizophagus irregularis TaxID=588596 RepID=A0A915ZQR9_9GLOM|nr:unnamed protein product [Rhizophagus irregularis]CAB5103886.1 unnamed protein product [Rhizophagus irregularis]CAB5387462.1 unnamed protein product [Rhizophagus irregularis]
MNEIEFLSYNHIIDVFSVLIIIGCIFIFHRARKIYMSKKQMPLEIKFPLYIAITHFLFAILEIAQTIIYIVCIECRKNAYNIMSHIIGVILIVNLLLGATIAIEVWKILKNNFEVNFSWGKKDYKLWLMALTVSVIFEFGDEYSQLFGKELFFIRLNKLDSNIYESDIYNSKKLKFYILVFCFQWAFIILYYILRRITTSFYIVYVYILAIAIGGLCNVIVFIRNEGIFYNLGSITQEETPEINDPETGTKIPSTEIKQENSLTESVSE